MPVLWAKGTDYYKVGGPEFAALVKKMSDGKFIITPFGPGEISGALDYGDGLSKGTFEMALWHDGYWAGRDMGVGYFGYMPFAQMDFSDFNYWFWEGGGVELAREYYDPLNIYYLSTSGYSDLEPVFSKKPIRSVEDFKGIKMRSSGIALSFFKNMGASPVALGGDATYEALSRGVIDAVEHTPAAMMMDMGVHEVTEYVIEPMYHQPYTNTAYYVYAPAWKKLPENFKAILTAASFQICEIFRTKSLKAEFEVKQKLKEKGMKFIWLPKEETDKMTKIAESLWKEHAKASPYAHKVIKSQTDFLKKLGRLPEDWKLD
ncbi:MAG: TRAP transporter substrate-binding protein DctP [Deltaproteobacteria bacterium]|nr:TRAP transporter substrate-binding protein DctP [Deltaproteobacteria bacterium]